MTDISELYYPGDDYADQDDVKFWRRRSAYETVLDTALDGHIESAREHVIISLNGQAVRVLLELPNHLHVRYDGRPVLSSDWFDVVVAHDTVMVATDFHGTFQFRGVTDPVEFFSAGEPDLDRWAAACVGDPFTTHGFDQDRWFEWWCIRRDKAIAAMVANGLDEALIEKFKDRFNPVYVHDELPEDYKEATADEAVEFHGFHPWKHITTEEVRSWDGWNFGFVYACMAARHALSLVAGRKAGS